jgi:hypothetical protein
MGNKSKQMHICLFQLYANDEMIYIQSLTTDQPLPETVAHSMEEFLEYSLKTYRFHHCSVGTFGIMQR